MDGRLSSTGKVHWLFVLRSWEKAVSRLENPKHDGGGLTLRGTVHLEDVEEKDNVIRAVGDNSMPFFDISAKPEPWRRGYFAALMALATAAENLEAFDLDSRRNILLPHEEPLETMDHKNSMLSSLKLSSGITKNARIAASPPPESFYEKLLSTEGLEDRQRIEAALAYAEYLDFKGRSDEADGRIRWALTAAARGLGQNGSTSVDLETGIIMPQAPLVSKNLVNAATALAVHLAQTHKPDQALPIALSVLRAYRHAPPIELSPPSITRLERKEDSPTDIQGFINFLKKINTQLSPPPFPPMPPTGNDPLTNPTTLAMPDPLMKQLSILETEPRDEVPASCDEAMVMAYVGEILFASSPSRHDAAMRMTKEAMEAAHDVSVNIAVPMEERAKCVQCVDVTMANLRAMIEKVKSAETETSQKQDNRRHSGISWFGTRTRDTLDSQNAKDAPLWKCLEDELVNWAQRWEREDIAEQIGSSKTKLWASPLLYLI
jgi:hypothetical protein